MLQGADNSACFLFVDHRNIRILEHILFSPNWQLIDNLHIN